MEEKIYRTICQICQTNCGIVVHANGNGAISVEGDPDHPMNRGRCCSKSAAIPELIHSRDRLRHPLRKTVSGFKRISWEEALHLASERLGEIRAKFGPLSLVRCSGAPVSYQGRDGFRQFMGAFGSPNMTGSANLCMLPRITAFKAVTGERRPEPDYDNTKLVLFWGTNPTASERFSGFAAYGGMRQVIPRLKRRGVRIISIDPYRTDTVREADQWIKIRPGADAALGLAMIHVVIAEELYDREFVQTRTFGFEALADHVRGFNPKWAEPLTGIPEEVIRELARAYATTKPAAIYEGNGFDMYANGVEAVRTVAILISLTGNLDAPGGNVSMPFARQSVLPANPAPVEKIIGRDRFPLFAEAPFPAIKEALLGATVDHPKAMIVHHCNPVLIQANERRTRQALKKLDFMIVSDIFPTATTEMADLVLPMTSDFESYGYRAYSSLEGGFMALARPVAPAIGESRPVFEVEYELAERMGLQQSYPFRDTLGWLRHMIKPSGVTFERLDEEQIVYATPPIKYRKYQERGFDTPSGKVEFYSRTFEAGGRSPLPFYADPAGEPLDPEVLAAKGFSLLGSTRRPAGFVHTKLKNIAALSTSYPEPFLWIHPEDASKRDIEEGNEAVVSSPRGEITIKTRITEDAQPGLVWIDFGWGNPTDGKASINVLTDDAHFDPISGGTPNRLFACEVKKK